MPNRRVYVIEAHPDLVKIGSSAHPRQRLVALQIGNPLTLRVAFETPLRLDAHQVEQAAHVSLAGKRSQGEWFNCTVAEAVEAIETALTARDAKHTNAADSIEKELRRPGLARAHPGRILARELKARATTPHQLALSIRVPANRITDIINGNRPVSPETALRLGRYFGMSPTLWTRLQCDYDIYDAEKRMGGTIKHEVKPAP